MGTATATTCPLRRSVTLTPLAERRPPRVVLLADYPAPDFSFTSLDGKVTRLSDYRGKVVLLDFWGTWCGPCHAAVPGLVAAYDKFHARGFEILGVDVEDTREQLQSFIVDKKLPWPEALDGSKGPIVSLFRIGGFPSYFLIGRDGTIAVAAPDGAKFDLEAELSKLFATKH
jgi:peroxiredoxin